MSRAARWDSFVRAAGDPLQLERVNVSNTQMFIMCRSDSMTRSLGQVKSWYILYRVLVSVTRFGYPRFVCSSKGTKRRDILANCRIMLYESNFSHQQRIIVLKIFYTLQIYIILKHFCESVHRGVLSDLYRNGRFEPKGLVEPRLNTAKEVGFLFKKCFRWLVAQSSGSQIKYLRNSLI